jgi:hypothetical protein
VRNQYYNVYQKVVKQYGAQSAQARKAKLVFDAYRDKRFGSIKGGQFLVGGMPERILGIKYFNRPRTLTVATGRGAAKQENLSDKFVKEAYSKTPDPRKLQFFYENFGKTNRSNWAEVSRVNNMVYVAGMANYYRAVMKTSYSEYYSGPGNSVYTKMGKQMVAQLRDLIKRGIEGEGGKKVSPFYNDIETYFGGVDSFSTNLLEWYYH